MPTTIFVLRIVLGSASVLLYALCVALDGTKLEEKINLSYLMGASAVTVAVFIALDCLEGMNYGSLGISVFFLFLGALGFFLGRQQKKSESEVLLSGSEGVGHVGSP